MDKFIESRPQRLCLMCGKCCRLVAAPNSRDEMLALADAGDESSRKFLDMFVPYSSIDEAKKVCQQTVAEAVKKSVNQGLGEPYFYCCKYISVDNKCSIYDERPQRCIDFPSACWEDIPFGCGYAGWVFIGREEAKKKVRTLKESVMDLKIKLKHSKKQKDAEKIIAKIHEKEGIINSFAKYGSKDW